MRNDRQYLISDRKLSEVHGNANFGGNSQRRVLDGTILKVAANFHSGFTARCIALEHGLVKQVGNRRCGLKLTKLGQQYLALILGDAGISGILDILEDQT